jgi:hypothetical protein
MMLRWNFQSDTQALEVGSWKWFLPRSSSQHRPSTTNKKKNEEEKKLAHQNSSTKSQFTMAANANKSANSRFAPFVPTLELPSSDVQQLAHEAKALVRAAVDEYLYYRTGAANWTKWKEVRRVDTVQIFRERQSVTKNVADSCGQPLLPEVLALGNVSGAVEDMLLGASAATATEMLASSRCLNERLSEAKILATMATPTEQDPFKSFTAKWFSFSLGSGLFGLRDCSIIEATGMVTLENGERLGYVLRHSVQFKGVPDLEPFGVLRAKIATWAIYRESGPGMVQCFVKSFHDLGAGTWKSMGLRAICDRALALCRLGERADTKKLVRLMTRSPGWNLAASKRASPEDGECGVCLAPLASSLLLGSSARQCRICHRGVCPHCLKKKTVCLANVDANSVVTQQLRVCAACVDDAQRVGSSQLQIEEVLEDRALRAAASEQLKPSSQLFTSSLTDSDASSEDFCSSI